jgi:hypothetical protein
MTISGPIPAAAPTGPAMAGVPMPPPGPGVQPPFAAPPTDGTRQRRWVAFGLAIGAVMLVCVGGVVGVGGLVVLGVQVVRDEAAGTVNGYLTAIQDEEYDDAYDRLCDAAQRRTSRAQFARAQSQLPGISSFSVGEVELAERILVPATISYDDRTMNTVRFVMEQDQSTGAIEVCGQED